MPAPASSASDLLSDPTLRDVTVIEGCKVLGGVALYAKVGQGGMGIVYRGRHCVLGVDMAVKVLKPSLAAEDERFALRFLREAKYAARVSHQNVVRLYDANQQQGLHYLAMEFVDGENLRGRVQRKGALGEGEALGLLLGAAQGLAEAHRAGMVHRDVKPDNVLVARDGRVKVVDLGLVRRDELGGDSVSLGSGLMGTPQYMPPEQFDTPDVGPAADVWALGACLWFLLTGEHPFEVTSLAAAARRVQDTDFPTLRERRPDVRAEVHGLFEKCVRRDARQRFPDARALVEALLPLQPWPESRLADDAAGSGSGGGATSLPAAPPRATLDRIRDVLATTTAVAGSDVRRSEAPTIASPGTTVPPAPAPARRQRGLAVAAVALLAAAAAGWYGHENAWFGSSGTEWDDAEKIARARSLVARAEELLPVPGALDEVVAKLEEALDLRPDFARAKALLALALDRRATDLLASDVHGALTALRRVVELDPANSEARERLGTLSAQLTLLLQHALVVHEPSHLAVLPAPRLTVRGSVPGDVAGVRIVAAPEGRADEAVAADAVVVAGTFQTALDVRPGAHRLHVEAKSRLGLHAVGRPLWVTVSGVSGDGGVDPALPARFWNAAGITMLPVAPRTFTMGSLVLELGRDDDELQHEVTLLEPFWLGRTEVTRQQWSVVMRTAPWRASGDGATATDGVEAGDADDRPVAHVSWHDVNLFCERLTALERDAGRLPYGYRYCLPSEAQWERTAHGDGYHRYVHGDDTGKLTEHAVFGGAAEPMFAGSHERGPGDFFDLAGNVAEWCADHADGTPAVADTYRDGVVEPLSLRGANRIARGGHFASPAADCRNAARVAFDPATMRADLGFRVALAKR